MKQIFRTFFFYYLPAILWMAGIFYLSDQSGWPRGSLEIGEYLVRKGAHVFEFFVLTIVVFRVVWHHLFRWPVQAFLFAGLVTLLYAVIDEFHQCFVVNREGKLSDVGIDLIGIGLAIGIIYWLYKKNNKYSNKYS